MVVILLHLLKKITHLAAQVSFIDYKSRVDSPVIFILVFNINDFAGKV